MQTMLLWMVLTQKQNLFLSKNVQDSIVGFYQNSTLPHEHIMKDSQAGISIKHVEILRILLSMIYPIGMSVEVDDDCGMKQNQTTNWHANIHCMKFLSFSVNSLPLLVHSWSIQFIVISQVHLYILRIGLLEFQVRLKEQLLILGMNPCAKQRQASHHKIPNSRLRWNLFVNLQRLADVFELMHKEDNDFHVLKVSSLQGRT